MQNTQVDSPSESSELLRTRGLKATPGRLAVLDVLSSMPHVDAKKIYDTVRAAHGSITLQSVHNSMADLTEAGLIRRIEPAGSSALYERRINDNHHHLVCRQCNKVVDVDCVVGEAPCLSPSDSAGFQIDTAEVTFWGICLDCQNT